MIAAPDAVVPSGEVPPFFILTDSELQAPSDKLPDVPLVKDRQVERRAELKPGDFP